MIPEPPEGWNKRRWAGIVRRVSQLASQHRQLAKQRGETLFYGKRELLTMVVMYPNCPYCGEPLRGSNLSLDHRTPLARGGTMDLENYDATCRRCNKRKGQLTADEYRAILEVIKDWPLDARRDVLMRLAAGSGMLRMLRAKAGQTGELHGKARREALGV